MKTWLLWNFRYTDEGASSNDLGHESQSRPHFVEKFSVLLVFGIRATITIALLILIYNEHYIITCITNLITNFILPRQLFNILNIRNYIYFTFYFELFIFFITEKISVSCVFCFFFIYNKISFSIVAWNFWEIVCDTKRAKIPRRKKIYLRKISSIISEIKINCTFKIKIEIWFKWEFQYEWNMITLWNKKMSNWDYDCMKLGNTFKKC